MNDSGKIVGYFIVACVVLLSLRWVDLWIVNAITPYSGYFNTAPDGFDKYRDYVTVITGLLTLIIGATSIGAFLSFKKFRTEEQKVLDSLKGEREKIVDRRKQLDMFLKIEEARNNLEYEWGFLSAIRLYDKAEEKCDSHHLLYTLRGNAYFFAAKRSASLCDGNECLYLNKAKCDFEIAVMKNKRSMLALYGLGQVLFQLALMERKKKGISTIDWNMLPPLDRKTLEREEVQKLKLLILKPEGDYFGAKINLVDEAILRIQDAIYEGYDDVVGDYTLATMYEAVDKVDSACGHYKNAYAKGHLPSGYQYCYLWLRKNTLVNNSKILEEIMDILNRVSVASDDFSKAAYALIFFIRINTITAEDHGIDVYHRVDKVTIENLFDMNT